MKDLSFDAVVIGGGAAGMAAALEVSGSGFSCALIEREDCLGGVLPQCIHTGFGLLEFKEELTGPEFAERMADRILSSGVQIFLSTTVLDLDASSSPKRLSCASPIHGMMRISAGAAVLAMGCREKNRGNVRIPGSRPAGVFTAGLAQRLVNIDGYLPGKEAVIIGSGDIGLIMARRLSWSGCLVKAVVEIMPYPAGLPRNIAQCLDDFGIPLRLPYATTRILGRDRVTGVEIAPIEGGSAALEKTETISCDTILLSVGLVPENELSRQAGIELNPMTGGPLVDARLMTGSSGVFACGNVLHVHDLVDYAAEEARRAGAFAAAWLKGERQAPGIRVKAGPNVRYVTPSQAEPGRLNKIYLRPLIVKADVVLEVRLNGALVGSQKKRNVRPSEMISLEMDPARLGPGAATRDAVVEIALS
jgi:NADPH-dependent 2,4-dienoyl-CoA reductase/sulfur reductase-like enzyme